MKPLRALIIDDEPLAHKVILTYAADVPFLNVVGQCYLATDAYTFLEENPVDLIFLDINMPRLGGLEFLRTLETPPAIIVTSAYEEYALEGFELRVTDYLLKPFRFERFLKAVTAARPTPTEAPLSSKSHLFVKVDRRHLQLSYAEIHYLESYGNYVKIWTGEKFHLTHRTLTSFVEELPPEFVRVHKSYVVHRHAIDYLEDGTIVLKGKKVIPVGKHYRKLVRDWLA